MKVVLVCEFIQAARGGAETSAVQYLQQLLDRGLEVVLITRSDKWPDAQAPDGLRIVTINPPGTRGLATATFATASIAAVRDNPGDVVHAITPCLATDIYEPRSGTVVESVARNLALRRSSATRWLKRAGNQLNLKQRTMLRLESQLLGRPDPPRVVAISNYVADQLQRHYGLQGAQVFKSFNGVTPPAIDAQTRAANRQRIRRDIGVSEEQPLALMVAHNFKLKGVQRWLEALALPDARMLHSVVVGKQHPGPYVRRAAALGVQQRVTFVGPRDDMAAVYAAADILVHPTYYDPCSRVVLEALLWSVPCVTTRFNGAAEAVVDGVTGRVLESPDDVAALAAAARDITAPQYALALQQKQPELRQTLAMSRHAEEVIELYTSMVRATH